MKNHQTRNSVPAYKFPFYVLLHRITDSSTNNDAEIENLINIHEEDWTNKNEDQAKKILEPLVGAFATSEQRKIICQFFGFDTNKERRECPSIAKEMDLSVCQVRKILNEGLGNLYRYLQKREKFNDEYWEENPPQAKDDIYEICQINTKIAWIPIIRYTMEKATLNRLFQMDVLFLGDLITKTEEDIFGHHHRCDKQARNLKDTLAGYGLHLSWNVENKDDKIESNAERHMAIKEFAKITGQTEEDIWRKIVFTSNMLNISENEIVSAYINQTLSEKNMFTKRLSLGVRPCHPHHFIYVGQAGIGANQFSELSVSFDYDSQEFKINGNDEKCQPCIIKGVENVKKVQSALTKLLKEMEII